MIDQSKLLHRDDLDLERIAEIEKKFSETHPGMKVIFAGDGNLSPEVQQAVESFEEHRKEMLYTGRCTDCKRQMENFPPEDDDWRPPNGWCHFTDSHGEIMAWQCPECDEKDGNERRLVSIEPVT